jgi:large subunit ribosomal protein L29
MRADKIREIDNNDLKNQLQEQEETLFRLKFQIGMGQTDGVRKLRELKKDRARMLSVLRERELKEAGK